MANLSKERLLDMICELLAAVEVAEKDLLKIAGEAVRRGNEKLPMQVVRRGFH